MHSQRLALASASVMLSLCIAAAGASAGRLRLTESRFRATWAPLTAYMFERFGQTTVSCNVTMEGAFHASTIAKVAESLIGLITRASLAGETCRNGTIRLLTETLPWHIRYDSFSGALPSISRVNVSFIGLSFEASASTLVCLARSTQANPMVERIDREAGGVISMSSDETIRIPGTGSLCNASLSYEGEARVTSPLGASITLTLI